MKAMPFSKRFLAVGLILLGIPVQHFRFVLDASAVAEDLDNTCWVVEQVVGIDHTDLCSFDLSTVWCAVPPVGVVGSDFANEAKPVEEAAKFVIPSLIRHEIIEASYIVKWRNGASII